MTISRLSFILAAVLCLPIHFASAQDWTGANWIWDTPDAASSQVGNEPVFFRHAFELPAQPKAASVQITADNLYELYINGQKIGADGEWNQPETFDVAKHLAAGKNVIAVRGQNQGSPAGLIAKLSIELPEKKKFSIGTGKNWRCSAQSPEGWLTKDFDDSKWLAASNLGGPEIGPWNIAASSGSGGGGIVDRNVSDPKITSYQPASEEQAKFELPEGFKIELVVSEPTIINPVCITHDEQGRLYVSESHTYRFGPEGSPLKGTKPNPIVRLDPLPDGKGYKRVLVADGFDDPVMGMAIRGNQLWAAANNYLFRFDLTEEGLAINKETIAIDKNKAWNPFGMFVLEWGPEGDLYMSVGNHDIDIYRVANDKERIGGARGSGIVMRMKPDATKMERLVHGLRVPYSFEIDPFGQHWQLSNGEGNPNRFLRVIEGVDYHCYSRGVSNEWLAGRHPLAPPCFELPRGACTQLMRYYGANFPKEYEGSLLLDNWGAHGFGGPNRTIARYVPDERNNIATKEDFIVCRDPHFRCSHIIYDLDGSLLISDWYGRDDESDLTGRVWRVSYTGPGKPEVKHKIDSPEWKEDAYALSALSSPSHLIRQKAIEVLSARGKALPLLDVAAKSPEPVAAAGALWVLARIGTKDALLGIHGGLLNSDWRVRRLAVNLLRRYEPSNELHGKVLKQVAANDKDPAVRVAAASALPNAEDRRAALLAALKNGAAEDQHLRYEAAWHLAEVADEAAFDALLASENENLHLAGLITIDVAGYEHRAAETAAMTALAKLLAQPGDIEQKLLLELTKLHDSPKLTEALRGLVARNDVPAAVTAGALLILRSKSGSSAKFEEAAVRRFLDAVKANEVSIQSTGDVLTLLELLKAEGTSEFAVAQVARYVTHGDGQVRESAHALAREFGPKASPAAAQLWPRLVNFKDNRNPNERLMELGTVLAVEAEPNAGNWTKVLAEADPTLTADTVRSWRQYAENPAMQKLLVDAAPALVKRQPELRDDLASVAVALKLDALKSQVDLPALLTDDAGYQKITLPAQPTKDSEALGRRVFERAGCVKCHTTVSQNSERAPSLAGIGKAQKVEYLVESVLEPSKVIKTGFETETIVTADGKIHSGLVKEDGDHLRVITADGESRVAKGDIDERTKQPKSLMPEGQHRTLSPREFADLVAYLQSLK